MIGRVREMLRFQAKAVTLFIDVPVLPGNRSVQKVARVKLHSRLGGQDLQHSSAGGFVHQGGATNGMDVTWRIEPAAQGAQLTIEHDFRPRLAPWAWFIDTFFTRPVAGRTLATFKAIAEAVDAAGAGSAPATEVFASRSSRPTKGAESESPQPSKDLA